MNLETFGFDSADSVKRFLVLLVAPLLAALNSKFGFGVPDAVVGSALGLAAVYIWQSGHKAALLAANAGTVAADSIKTANDAAKVLAPEVKAP